MQPLPHDIFSTRDFYKDRDLWSDNRYYRCNSPVGLEQIWGAYEVPLIGDDPPRTAAWGFCDRDYPREEIVSPYGFKTAKEHYAALLQEARSKGGPTVYTQATLPDWSGQYRRERAKTTTWYYGAVLQIPTYLSLLTPEYQQRFVQADVSLLRQQRAAVAGSYCWPEGFMRRFAQYGGARINLVVTPDLVLDMRNAAKTLITQIHVGREFIDDPVAGPRLGPDVPQWTGETVGFWDGEALISWTVEHARLDQPRRLRVQQQAPVDRDLHAAQRRERQAHRHQARGGAVRRGRVRRARPHRAQLEQARRPQRERSVHRSWSAFRRSSRSNGVATPVSPGTTFEYTFLDILGRPWAQIWERYHENGMERPEGEDIFSFPNNE